MQVLVTIPVAIVLETAVSMAKKLHEKCLVDIQYGGWTNAGVLNYLTIIFLIEDLTGVLNYYLVIKQVEEKRLNARLCRAFYRFFATSLINSLIQEHKC